MTAQEHIAFGLHSNIPRCCVKYFIGDWQTDFWKGNRHDPRKVGYVRCPECEKRDYWQQIHRCTVKCLPFLRSIGRHESARIIIGRQRRLEYGLAISRRIRIRCPHGLHGVHLHGR